MIDAIFFDYDGVLTTDKTGTMSTCRFLSAKTGIPIDAWLAAFAVQAADLRIGKMTRLEAWPAVCAAVGGGFPSSLLMLAYESTPKNQPAFRLARTLRKAGYKVGLITDNTRDRFDHLRMYQRLDDIFAPIVVSAEEGCTKNAPRIFWRALVDADVQPSRAIFVDNTRSNLHVAAEIGMKTIYFDDEKNDVLALVRDLAQFGVNVPTEASGA